MTLLLSVIKACIFDLDGVIVDTARYHYLAWKRLAKELGHELTELENEQLKGVSRMESLERVLRFAGYNASADEKIRLAEKKNHWFNEYVEAMTQEEILPGAMDLIRQLRVAGVSVGLASSSKNARKVLDILGIGDEFDAVVDGSMIHHTKPHPEIFLRAAALLGAAPQDCVVIEDAEAGVEAALAAGMKCVGVGSPAQLRKANRIYPTTSDITISALRQLELIKN